MSEKLLDISNLHVQYHTDDAVVHALNGFNLSVQKGETLGLVGETGAGKTTMALSLLRLLPERVGKVSQGSIFYGGKDVLKASKVDMIKMRGAQVSMIFQDPMTSLNPILTVGDQIMEVLKLHFKEMSRDQMEARVDEIMEMVGIPKTRKSEYPHQFSGGMKQRIGIAMALISEPELLIADEPTTALDVTIQAQILNLMKELKRKFNSAMILITHNLGVVAEVCENVAVVYAGEVIEQGTVDEVFTRTSNHPYTQGLFNSIPDLTTTTDRLIPIPGYMADPTNLPKGCKFADRCPCTFAPCREENPQMYSVEGTHKVKCFLYAENRGM